MERRLFLSSLAAAVLGAGAKPAQAQQATDSIRKEGDTLIVNVEDLDISARDGQILLNDIPLQKYGFDKLSKIRVDEKCGRIRIRREAMQLWLGNNAEINLQNPSGNCMVEMDADAATLLSPAGTDFQYMNGTLQMHGQEHSHEQIQTNRNSKKQDPNAAVLNYVHHVYEGIRGFRIGNQLPVVKHETQFPIDTVDRTKWEGSDPILRLAYNSFYQRPKCVPTLPNINLTKALFACHLEMAPQYHSLSLRTEQPNPDRPQEKSMKLRLNGKLLDELEVQLPRGNNLLPIPAEVMPMAKRHGGIEIWGNYGIDTVDVTELIAALPKDLPEDAKTASIDYSYNKNLPANMTEAHTGVINVAGCSFILQDIEYLKIGQKTYPLPFAWEKDKDEKQLAIVEALLGEMKLSKEKIDSWVDKVRKENAFEKKQER